MSFPFADVLFPVADQVITKENLVALNKGLNLYREDDEHKNVVANIQLTEEENPSFVLEIIDETIIGDIDITINDLDNYSLEQEGFVIRATDSKRPELELKMIVTNPVDLDTEYFRMKFIIRKTKTVKCAKCVKTLVDVTLIAPKLLQVL